VVDMFAGIGYFSIPMAVHSRPERIYACEVNPVAFHYLEENARINRVGNLRPLLGDCRETAPEGVADRVIMGYLRAQGFLEKAMRVAGRKAILHYHEACPNELIGTRPWAAVRDAAEKAGRSVEQLHLRRLKSYAPGVTHVVLDARVSA
jgi:tRNA wybutosine-synthesizing protein 2